MVALHNAVDLLAGSCGGPYFKKPRWPYAALVGLVMPSSSWDLDLPLSPAVISELLLLAPISVQAHRALPVNSGLLGLLAATFHTTAHEVRLGLLL